MIFLLENNTKIPGLIGIDAKFSIILFKQNLL